MRLDQHLLNVRDIGDQFHRAIASAIKAIAESHPSADTRRAALEAADMMEISGTALCDLSKAIRVRETVLQHKDKPTIDLN